MKLTKTLIAAAALAAFALPMTATAQTGDVIVGVITNVTPDMYIIRDGQPLKVVENSAIRPGDQIFSGPNGGGTISLSSSAGNFAPCTQGLSAGSIVSVGLGNYCSSIANVSPIGPQQLRMVQTTSRVGSVGGTGGMQTALGAKQLLIGLGLGAAAYGIYEIVDDGDDDEPTSP